MTNKTKEQIFSEILLQELIDKLDSPEDRPLEAEAVLNLIEKERQLGKLSSLEIYEQCVSYLYTAITVAHTKNVVRLHDQIAHGITELIHLKKWTSLRQIACHAYRGSVDILKGDNSQIAKAILPDWEFKLKILNSGGSGMFDLCKEYVSVKEKDLLETETQNVANIEDCKKECKHEFVAARNGTKCGYRCKKCSHFEYSPLQQ